MRVFRPQHLTLFVAILIQLVAGNVAAQNGRVAGLVTDAGTLQPLAGAQVFVSGLNVGGLTGPNGRYTFELPAGARTVEVSLIGYGRGSRQLTIAVGQTTTADFSLSASAISLEAIVATGVGVQEQRKRLGYASASVGSQAIADRPVVNVSQALRGTVAGVMPSANTGEAGNGQRIRMRGQVSLTQRNDPILYVDGVRVDSRNGTVGNMVTSRLDDINPADIDRIEVIKGAAAATLFGTEASAGVIQVFTKSGQSGAARYSFSIDQGMSAMRFTDGELIGARIPPNMQWDTINNRMIVQTPMRDILKNTRLQNYNLSVSGGTDDFHYFLSGRYMNEDGVAPNSLTGNISGRAKIDLNHGHGFRSETSIALTHTGTRVPSEGGSLGPMAVQTFAVPLLASPENDLPYGEALIAAKDLYGGKNWLYGDRYSASFKGIMTWTPLLVTQAVVGFERSDQLNDETVELGEAKLIGNNVTGKRRLADSKLDQVTLDFNTSWSPRLSEDFGFQFWVGGQAFFEKTLNTTLESRLFPAAGLSLVQNGATVQTFNEGRTEVRNAGLFSQVQVDFRDRLFVTAGLRADGNSAFGTNFGLSRYPKISGSYVLSDEPFWPGGTAVGLMRLRVAYGQSGLQPGTFDAQQTWVTRSRLGGSVVWPGNVGNPDLRPEKSTELEMGADLGLFDDRIGLEITHYSQTTTDAIVPRPLAPSLGFTSNQIVNVGEMSGKGWEGMVRWNVIRRPTFDWAMQGTIGTVDQKVVSLGLEGTNRIAFTGLRAEYDLIEGYAPAVWRTTVIDPNNPYTTTKPIGQVRRITEIVPNILKAANGADSMVIHPYSAVPRMTGSYSTDIGLPKGFRLHALFTGAKDFTMFSTDEVVRYQNGVRPDAANINMELWDVNTSEDRRKELATEYAFHSNRAWGNWIDDASYLRFQELSLLYRVPGTFAGRFGMTSLNVNLSATNLHLWTKYDGVAEPGTSAASTSNLLIDNHRSHLPSTRGLTLSISGGF